MGKNVLILTPQGWYVEECCVKSGNSDTAPTAALVLAAYLRALGHNPQVLTHKTGSCSSMSFGVCPDVVIVYAPWRAFSAVSAPVFQAFKRQFLGCITILVMYESLADFEVQAMIECPEIDYAVIPNEKEISVGVILEHGEPRVPGGFGERAGIVYRDAAGVPQHDGKRRFAGDFCHLPYFGDELTGFLRANPDHTYRRISILLERGCPKTCSFCPLRCTRVRYRDPEVAVRELELAARLFGGSDVGIMTHEVLFKHSSLEEFADLVIAGNIKVQCCIGARCDLVDDLDLLLKLKAAGINELYFGIESATEEGRARINKPIKDEEVERAISLARDAGLKYHAAFIAGFPWEDETYMATMREYARQIAATPNSLSIRLSRLIPYPGLPIEEELIKAGILPHRATFYDWNHRADELAATFSRTARMDSPTLNHWCKRIIKEAYVNQSMAISGDKSAQPTEHLYPVESAGDPAAGTNHEKEKGETKAELADQAASAPGERGRSSVSVKMKRGETLFNEGNIAEAERCFRTIIAEDPRNAEAYNNLAVTAIQKGELERAIDRLNLCLEIDACHKDAIANYVEIAKLLNKPALARPVLERFLRVHPGDMEISALYSTLDFPASRRMKVAVLCLPGQETFLGDIVDFLKSKYEVRTYYTKSGRSMSTAVGWADIVWLEWANELTVKLTNIPSLLDHKLVVCRLHSYEAFSPFFSQIRWEKIDDLIFVAPHIKDYVLKFARHSGQKVKRIHVVPNGIDPNKYPFKERSKGKNLACLGNVNYKKGPMLLVHAFAELVRCDPGYRLFVGGKFQDDRYSLYFSQMAREMGLAEHLRLDGWIEDVPGWLEDKHYLVSTSVLEGHPVGIMEAMACGIKPVIHNFVGARGIFEGRFLWNTIPEFVEMVRRDEYNSHDYRAYIENRFSLNRQLSRLEDIFRQIEQDVRHPERESVLLV